MREGSVGPRTAQCPPCVLVVDDEDALRTVLARELRRLGFVVYSTGSGAEAVVTYCRAPARIDVILMDVNMPGMSGPEALAAIRAVDPGVRCCFMTADDRPGLVSALMASGAAAVFRKPFSSVNYVSEKLYQITGQTTGESDPVAGGSVT